jgi:hypothetical protein
LIRTVLQLLATHGYIGTAATPQLNVLGSSGSSVTFEVFVGRARFLHVKASELTSLRREYESLVRARADYGTHVPEPLLYRTLGDLDIMVTDGVRHAPLPSREVANGTGAVVDRLASFFEKQARLRNASPAKTHADWLHDALATPVAQELGGGFLQWLDRQRSESLAALPEVPQHGDFTANNLGLADGELVVFDWEDGGASSLHGLDLCTLLMSLVEFDRERFASLSCGKGGGVAARLTAAAGIAHSRFLELIPAYLLAWLALKASYSPRLQGRVRSLLQSYLVT